MFNTLNKELYSLKQGSGENVAEFGVHLSQQVQIFQSEYPGRIQQEHIEEMKWDHFYEPLNPEYWWILAHKVDGEHPARYSGLFLAPQTLERWAQTRDPPILNTTPTGGLNVAHSQTSGNLFPFWKLNGSHSFTAQSAIVESKGVAEDSGGKAEEAEDAESLGEEDPETLSGIGGADQSVGYIICFAKVAQLYQRKKLKLLWMW